MVNHHKRRQNVGSVLSSTSSGFADRTGRVRESTQHFNFCLFVLFLFLTLSFIVSLQLYKVLFPKCYNMVDFY